ncbi:MAG: NAD(P)H-dependent glycerol-3-phosphate dehydrogenase [Thiobacillaceae bacterium]
MNIAILGAGAWGTALAIHFAPRHQVTLWSRNPEHISSMSSDRQNARYLPGHSIPSTLKLESDLDAACRNAELLIISVPTAGFRPMLHAIADKSLPLIWVCKGLEPGTGKRLDEVAAEVLPSNLPRAVLSGPSFAQEVAAGHPTALTLASSNAEFAKRIASRLHGGSLRIYTSEDVIGVEIGGALKNVMAIAAGISDGLGFGHNARAALITRAAAEMARLGIALGAHTETIMGLTGMGDLILTCTGELSRNRQVGLKLAEGKTLPEILLELGHVAEGVNTAREAIKLADQFGVDMPITGAVKHILFDSLPARQAVEDLLSRSQKAENQF